MKRLVSIIIIMLALAALVSCGKTEYKGPTEVNYGEVNYIPYSDGTPVTFEYLDCFKPTEMDEKDYLVAYTPDGLGVLMYKSYDPMLDAEYETSPSYEKPNKNYNDVVGFTDEEAMDYMKTALGMMESKDVEYTVDVFTFDRIGDDLRLYLEATALYKNGEVQKLWMLKIITSKEYVYTLQAFAPASIVTKYGPAFRNAEYAA